MLDCTETRSATQRSKTADQIEQLIKDANSVAGDIRYRLGLPGVYTNPGPGIEDSRRKIEEGCNQIAQALVVFGEDTTDVLTLLNYVSDGKMNWVKTDWPRIKVSLQGTALRLRSMTDDLDKQASSIPAPDERNIDDGYRPGSWFAQKTSIPPSRLRAAAGNKRKAMRVRTKGVGKDKRYSVADARQNWPHDMTKQ